MENRLKKPTATEECKLPMAAQIEHSPKAIGEAEKQINGNSGLQAAIRVINPLGSFPDQVGANF